MFRPIMILRLFALYQKILNRQIDDVMIKTIIFKYLYYSEERLLIKGRVETGVLIVDCQDLSLCQI